MPAVNIADEIIKINAPLKRFDCCFASLSKMFMVGLIADGILGSAFQSEAKI
jgi:hypothetical protein